MIPPDRRPARRFEGRTLYLTADPALLEAQLHGRDLTPAEIEASLHPGGLLANISTDEITPGWVCYYYDETLARYCLVGLRGGLVARDAVARGGFSVLVAGPSKGCGSSRETAPYSEVAAGIRLVVAPTLEKIYRQNAQNIGLLTSTDLGLLPRLARGEALPLSEFTRGLDPISAGVVEEGGLFAYNRARLEGRVRPPAVSTAPRPMTLCEKILARHAVVDAGRGEVGVSAVKPGDAFFARADVRFTHDYVTAMAESLFVAELGPGAKVLRPESVYAFRDHLTLLDRVMPRAHKDLGLDAQAQSLATAQEAFARRQGVRLYGEVRRPGREGAPETVGSEAICHNKVVEELALPGQLVLGTDSHTCMAGALGCVAFGVGSTDMANAWFTGDVRVTVPGTVRFVLEGRLGAGVSAKDVMLHLLRQPFFRTGEGIGKVIEFAGPSVTALSIDERATLTNMAVEAGGFTGIVAADDAVVAYLVRERGADEGAVRELLVRGDDDASYAASFTLNLGEVAPMVALPGDPRNGVPVTELPEVAIDIAYGGSCTGGKRADMDMYASVLARAVARGERVKEGVRFYIQFGSQAIRAYAEAKGYLELFVGAGAELVEPSCGACIKAGPGVSDAKGQVTVSAQNRNFPGRSGPGDVYLASPLVVAASALAGKIVVPPSS